MFASLVYLLCFATCAACAVLLARSWWRTHTRLLLWTAWSFGFLALNNALVVVDLIFLRDVDLSLYRSLAALVAGLILVIGFVWESE